MSNVSESAYQAPGLVFDTEPHHEHDHARNALMGFWIFMMSDLIIFGLFFATYGTMLTKPSMAGGPGPKEVLELSGAAWETGALLLSTFTFGLASLAIKYDQGKSKVLLWMGVTLVLGLCFLGLEFNEFATMFHAGHVPQRSGFLTGFFGLVPLHGLHVTAGSIWLITMMIVIAKGGITDITKSRVARLALFWHFLDLIWVGIFSVVYLGGLA
jgi:cytochrome o ubiquinol oxidase subunit III